MCITQCLEIGFDYDCIDEHTEEESITNLKKRAH